MCRKCLFLADDDTGVDWMPVHHGTGMRTGTPKSFLSAHKYTAEPSPNLNKIRFGDSTDGMPGWKKRPGFNRKERIEFDPNKDDYTAKELEQLADQFLRDDARSIDPETGKERGIGGDDPILFDEHLYQRQKREILNENGVPEPGLVQGIYYRTHPEGRKINSEEQRKKHGASYYR